jgi:hypothetical protein
MKPEISKIQLQRLLAEAEAIRKRLDIFVETLSDTLAEDIEVKDVRVFKVNGKERVVDYRQKKGGESMKKPYT